MVLLAQNTNLTACAMQKVLRIQPEWTVFPIWVRTKINYKDSLAQDIDLVKLSILYIVFCIYPTHKSITQSSYMLMKLPYRTD